MLHYVICDDQTDHLKAMLESLEPLEQDDGHIELTTGNPDDVLDYARDAAGDTLYFLDLKLDESDRPLGLKLCQQVLALDAKAYVVYVSAYSQYALECCRTHAFDFLVKPFSREQLVACVKAVMADIAKRSTGIPLQVKAGSRIVRLNQLRILYFSRNREYLTAHTLDGEWSWRESFESLSERLEPSLFLRVHNGYVVNLDQVTEADSARDLLVMTDKSEVPYSRRNEKAVLAAMKLHRKEAGV